MKLFNYILLAACGVMILSSCSSGGSRMKANHSAVFGDFSKGMPVHISITPNGNDTWVISEFNLPLDFSSPKIIQQFKWNRIRLTQDSREIDLMVNQQNNGALKYDLKANRQS